MKSWLKRNYYRVLYYKLKVKIGHKVILDTRNEFEGRNVIGDGTHLATSKLGLGTYIADKSIIKNATIGRFCSIGSFVQTGLGTHPSENFVSSHPAFYSTVKQAGFTFAQRSTYVEHKFLDSDNKYVVVIGNDVWIGNNVVIMDGVTIGDGAIVATGSIVTKDVLPYTIVGGVPAKVIKARFDAQQVKSLQSIKWWDWDLEKIQGNSKFFDNVNTFTANVKL